nr:pancreatic triacylglycerol lipase-like [Onthophagus taurus]
MYSYLKSVASLLPIFLISVRCESDTSYNSTGLIDRYPGYGESWVFLPDGDGKPRVALLELPNWITSRIGRAEDLVSFTLFTRYNENGQVIFLQNLNLKNTTFDPNKETKIVTHGWMSNGKSNTCMDIKNAYLQLGDYNVFVYDWEPIANNFAYPIVASRVDSVGTELAKFVGLLIANGCDRMKIHLVGHSLGAHVTGVAGSKFGKEKIGRITGLDPAGPFFSTSRTDRLSENSAKFVDVIHTSGWVVGYGESIGTVDFFPNGGIPPQPGCSGLPEIIEGCSHARSWQLFRDSIESANKYMAKKCESYGAFKMNKCDGDMISMGEHVRNDAKGNYYLKTNSNY